MLHPRCNDVHDQVRSVVGLGKVPWYDLYVSAHGLHHSDVRAGKMQEDISRSGSGSLDRCIIGDASVPRRVRIGWGER